MENLHPYAMQFKEELFPEGKVEHSTIEFFRNLRTKYPDYERSQLREGSFLLFIPTPDLLDRFSDDYPDACFLLQTFTPEEAMATPYGRHISPSNDADFFVFNPMVYDEYQNPNDVSYGRFQLSPIPLLHHACYAVLTKEQVYELNPYLRKSFRPLLQPQMRL